jgi:hypothetical protein
MVKQSIREHFDIYDTTLDSAIHRSMNDITLLNRETVLSCEAILSCKGDSSLENIIFITPSYLLRVPLPLRRGFRSNADYTVPVGKNRVSNERSK